MKVLAVTAEIHGWHLAILRKEIAPQYLLGSTNHLAKDLPQAPRELILSSYLP